MAHTISCLGDKRVVTMIVPGNLSEAQFVLMEMLRTSTSLRDFTLRDFSIKECEVVNFDPGGFLIDCDNITTVMAGGMTFRAFTTKLWHVPKMLGYAKERVLGYLRVGCAHYHVYVPTSLRDELVEKFSAANAKYEETLVDEAPMEEPVAEVKKFYDF